MDTLVTSDGMTRPEDQTMSDNPILAAIEALGADLHGEIADLRGEIADLRGETIKTRIEIMSMPSAMI